MALRSPEAEAWRGWYKLARWCGKNGRRAQQLAKSPICEWCLKRGLLNDGSLRADGSVEPNPRRRYLVADHIVPHRGDPDLFWNGALQTLCPDDHDGHKQAIEVRGFSVEVGVEGWPIDPRHPANWGTIPKE